MGKFVLVIVGPTCSGKTQLSQLLSRNISAEIISADSRQFYRYLNIGTAKPTSDELRTTKHHLIDFLNPDEYYNVSKFESQSIAIIEDCIQSGKTPIIVGGSGLYIRAVVDGIFDSAETDEELRFELKEQKDKFGNEYLYGILKTKDPEAASTMLPQNWKRVIRAIEVMELTGKSILDHHTAQKRNDDFTFIQIGLDWERNILYRNIDSRVERMISLGLVSEVQNILDIGYSSGLNSLNTVGYKEIISYLNGEINLDRAIELIKRNTRRLAKRQMTWFRRDKRIKWYQISDFNELDEIQAGIIRSLI